MTQNRFREERVIKLKNEVEATIEIYFEQKKVLAGFEPALWKGDIKITDRRLVDENAPGGCCTYKSQVLTTTLQDQSPKELVSSNADVIVLLYYYNSPFCMHNAQR